MKLRVRFSKFGPVKFIGHLDIMRFVQKAVKAAGIPVKYTEGYSPHQILSFAHPLGVGVESESEYFDLEVTTLDGCEHFKENLNRQMCEGMSILGVYLLPDDTKNAMASVKFASYRVELYHKDASDLLSDAVERFIASESVLSYKETKTGVQERDLKEAVKEISYVKESNNGEKNAVIFTADASSGGNLKPATLMEALYRPFDITFNPWDYQIIRTEVYKEDRDGKPVPLSFGLEEL